MRVATAHCRSLKKTLFLDSTPLVRNYWTRNSTRLLGTVVDPNGHLNACTWRISAMLFRY
jgi:hypothetical protein